MLPSACCHVEVYHVCPTQRKQGARSTCLISEMKDPTYYVRGRVSGLWKGMDSLSGDRQRLLGHSSLRNLPWPSCRDLAHCSTVLSSARGKAGRGADLEHAAALDGAAPHSVQKGSRRRGSSWAPPGTLCEAALKERQNHSCLITSGSEQHCLVCIKANPSLQGLSRHAACKQHFPRARRFSIFFSFPWAPKWETKAHNSFYLCFCNSGVILYSQ